MFRSATREMEYNYQGHVSILTGFQGFSSQSTLTVFLDIGVSIPLVTYISRPRWKIKKAECNKFTEKLDKNVCFLPRTKQVNRKFHENDDKEVTEDLLHSLDTAKGKGGWKQKKN